MSADTQSPNLKSSVKPKSTRNSAPSSKRKGSKQDKDKVINKCPICDDPVEDSSDSNNGHDAVYCEGICKGWLHRRCAGLSKAAFSAVCQSDDQFLCPHCSLHAHRQEQVTLKKEIESLRNDVDSLKLLLKQSSNQSRPNTQPVDSKTETGPQSITTSYANITASNIPKTTLSSKSIEHSQSNRKFNIVIFGVKECPTGSLKSSHLAHDSGEVMAILSRLDASIQPSAIKDLFRLGKFKSDNQRPRPILVQFLRSCDVVNILSKTYLLSRPLLIKPDMSPQERDRNSKLLKVRWSLIQGGTDRKSIKISKSSIYVDNHLYGKLDSNSVFQPCDSSSATATNTSNLSTSPLNTSSTFKTSLSPLTHSVSSFHSSKTTDKTSASD